MSFPPFSRRPGRARHRRRPFLPRLENLEGRLAPAVTYFTVSNPGDNGGINPGPGAGTGTLRQAIIDANATPGPDVIQFKIPGGGPQTILLAAGLPTVTNKGVTIDGTTQAGYSGSPVVVLDGSFAGSANALDIAAPSCEVKGLAIVNLNGTAIVLNGASATNDLVDLNYLGTSDGIKPAGDGNGVAIFGANNNTVEDNVISGNSNAGVVIASSGVGNQVLANYIGTTADGSNPLGNFYGVLLEFGASKNTIGAAGAGNVISGNTSQGVALIGNDVTGNQVLANLIGTSADGTSALGNGDFGVILEDGTHGNVIGAAGAGNTISSNAFGGVLLVDSSANLVQANLIGTSADAGSPLGNGYNGVELLSQSSGNTIGGPGAGNLIAYNQLAGVVVKDKTSTGNTISENGIFGNGGLGIDLGGSGVPLANTPGGPHVGPNHLQNYPVLNAYTSPGTITGKLNSTPHTTFILEFFANPAPDASGHGPGQDFLGSLKVTTNATGNASFTFFYSPIPGEPYLSATATNTATGDTSEFSATVDAALTTFGQTLNATEGAQFSGIVATFTDADPNATAGSFTAKIAWGDGTVTTGTVTAIGPNFFAVTGSHTYAEEASSLPVTVTITDVPANAQATANSLMSVADAPLSTVGTSPVSAVEGAKFSGQLGTFFDPDPGAVPSDYTVTIAWGDGSSSTGTVTPLGNGLFAVNGTHTYAEEGKYGFSWVVKDAGGSVTFGADDVKVADAPLQGTGKSLKLPVFNRSFSGVVATFTDADPNGVVADYAATIDWGDGTTSTGTIGSSNGVFAVSGKHTYGYFFGKRTITITITDAGGSTVTVQSTIQ